MTSETNPAVNIEAVRAKYRTERDKRLRPERNEQFRAIEGILADYGTDPYTPFVPRAPLEDEVDVAVLGAGLGGLLAAARLRETGLPRIRLIDQAGGVGGTWYWNRYPGAQCDIESYIYLPLLEEVGYIPKEKYAFQPEILGYLEALARKYDLYHDACFHTVVTELVWNEDSSKWIIFTDRGDRMKASFVIVGNGPLSKPKLPGIPGIERFKGHSFHTSRWDYAYTGGDASGHLSELSDKTVGIIGTGPTGIQCIPHLGEGAKRLFVFQRTPSAVWERNNKPTDPEWAKSLTPGWQPARMMNFDLFAAGRRPDEDLVSDGWTYLFGNLQNGVISAGDGPPSASASDQAEIDDFIEMERIRTRIDGIVSDRATADSLKPHFRVFCKRPCFHDEYLKSFNLPNVTLVDTDGRGVDQVTEHGVISSGRLYELDCLVFATGFQTSSDYTHRNGYDLVGRGGRRLSEWWHDGVRSLFGLQSHGFPNCFFLGYTQTGSSTNYTHAVTQQVNHLVYVMKGVLSRGGAVVDVSVDAEAMWVKKMSEKSGGSAAFLAECTPGRFNDDGNLDAVHGKVKELYGGGPLEFWAILQAWRDSGDLAGLELEKK